MMRASKIFQFTDFSLPASASALFDLARCLASVLVVLTHIRALFFVKFSEVLHPSLLDKLLWLISSLGHQAVIVFFVLSGFFISSTTLKSLQQGHWSWSIYLTHRLARLWVVLLPALILTLLWDGLGIAVFGNHGVYSGLPDDVYVLNFSAAARLGAGVFLNNLFFLQGILGPTYGSNGPLWSLSYEFWYYVAFPCLALLSSSRAAAIRCIYGVLTIALFLFVGFSISSFFLIWLMGAVVRMLPKPRVSAANGITFVCICIVLVLSLVLSSFLNDPVYLQFLIAVIFSAFMYTALALRAGPDQSSKTATVFKSISAKGAGFSYTLYLVHMPLLVFLHAAVHNVETVKWQPTVWTMTGASLILLCVLFYAWGISRLTEAKTVVVRLQMERLVARFKPLQK